MPISLMFSLLSLLSFASVASGQEPNQGLSSMMTCDVFKVRLDKITPYLSSHGDSEVKSLFLESVRSRSETGILTIKNNPEQAIPGGRYVMTQSIWADILATSMIPRIVSQFDELRYSPFFSGNADLIVYFDETTDANLLKVERLLRIANAMKLRFHVIWLGTSLESSEKYRLGQILAVSSGGRMVLLDKNLSCVSQK